MQDTVVKQNLIRTIDLIGKALHPDHLKTDGFIFGKRGDLINHLLVSIFVVACDPVTKDFFYLQGYLRSEPIASPIATETRALAIAALATLSYPDVDLLWLCIYIAFIP